MADITRKELYSKFGCSLVQAICEVMLDEINAIRSSLSMTQRTKQQLMNSINTKMAGIEPIDWDNEN